MILIFSWPTLDSEILTLETKAGVAMGVGISESGHEGSYHHVWKPVSHTMLPSMRTAVALATPSPRHLPSFKFLKPQTG